MTKEKIFYKISYAILGVLILISLIMSIFKTNINLSEQIVSELIYFVLVLIPLLVIGCIATNRINSKQFNKKVKLFSIIATWLCLVFVFLFILLSVNHRSHDYDIYLSNWVDYYRQHSIKESLYSIIEITNYAPAYNYFLIIISKIPMYDLHLIKYVSFMFSILLAFTMCKIISKIRKSDFNYLLFVVFLLLPFISIEYTTWAQCDAIYTCFAITAFYFALCKKSKLSFLFLGLSFIFKLQFLFIVPIMFVLLIIKDEEGNHYLKWKDVWIPFAMYLINCIPVFAGRSLWEMLMVYANQSVYDTRISGDCSNICLIYYYFCDVRPDTLTHNVLLWLHIVITFVFMIIYLIIVFTYNKKKTFTLYDIVFWSFAFSMTMVFLMPKMLDRFYFISVTLCIIFMFAFRDKHSCILCLLTNLFFSITMIRPFYSWSKPAAVVMLIVTFIDFIYMMYVIISKYAISLKRKNKLIKT